MRRRKALREATWDGAITGAIFWLIEKVLRAID